MYSKGSKDSFRKRISLRELVGRGVPDREGGGRMGGGNRGKAGGGK